MEVMMNNTQKIETEPIVTIAERLDLFRATLIQHPLLIAAEKGELPRETLLEFAYHQYSDSILWIPMLAQMRSRVSRSRRLQSAIEDNIAHEAGLGAESHVSMAARMMRSLGVRSLEPFSSELRRTFERSASLWLSDEFADFAEPEVAGFLLTAETLVPLMFAAMVSSFEAIGCDATYFREHVAVDGDEHARWMAEATADVVALYGDECIPAVLDGMDDAWDETREVPDVLWQAARCVSH
jgi:pyrroloquinoline quinone (PQQ) biosynthesis protein C